MAIERIIPTKVDPARWYEPQPIDIETIKPDPPRDVLLVCGDGHSLLDDLDKFYGMVSVPFDIMCINHAALAFPGGFDHFVAGDSHAKQMQQLAEKLPEEVLKHCWNPESWNFDIRWVKQDNRGWNGTTANLALKIGLALDYIKIVLAGVPMDGKGHWYKKALPATDRKLSNDHRHHLWFWSEMATRPVARFIRSLSGNTKDLFGEPTKEWLLPKGGVSP